MKGKKAVKSFKCDICEKCLEEPYSNLVSHIKTQHKMKHHCKKCLKSFKTEEALKAHNLEKHSDSEPKFECKYCHKKLASDLSLKQHVRVSCKSIPNKVVKRKKCKECDETFQEGLSFDKHKCGKVQIGQCQLCDKEFLTKKSMSNHITKMHSCKKCDTSKIRSIKDHLKSSKCGQRNDNKTNLENIDKLEIFQNVFDLVKKEFTTIPTDFERKLKSTIFNGILEAVDEIMEEGDGDANIDESNENLEKDQDNLEKVDESMDVNEIQVENNDNQALASDLDDINMAQDDNKITDETFNQSNNDEDEEVENMTCQICDKIFNRYKEMKDHVKDQHGVCAVCEQKWDNFKGYHECKTSGKKLDSKSHGNESGLPKSPKLILGF